MLPINIRIWWLPLVLIALLACRCVSSSSSTGASNRYSFSLTTFDPSGKLGQVDRAVEAAARGPPIAVVVVVATNDNSNKRIFLAAPQMFPSSPFVKDDGTPRMVRITPELVLAHTGLSADGRMVCAAAQTLALQYRYTYNTDIPVDSFLQGISLLFQEYTMKAGRRPFGCTVVVAYCPSGSQNKQQNSPSPGAFRIDPSGSIVALDKCSIVNGKGDEDLFQLKDRITASSSLVDDDTAEDSLQDTIAQWLYEQLSMQAKRNRVETVAEKFIVASVSSDGLFQRSRHNSRQVNT